MSTLAPLPATITPEELLQMADASNFELVDGRLVERNVSIDSSWVAMRIGHLLATEADRTGLANVFPTDLGYQCFTDDPNRIRKPDASVVRAQRMKGLDGDRGFMPIPADLAVEVVSPNDLAYELAEKVEEYLLAGFGAIWVVHPNLKTVTLYRAGGSVSVLHENDIISGDPALPDFRCRVGEFFPAAAG